MFFADVIIEGPQGRTVCAYFNNITDIGPSSVSYFDAHDFDIYSIFVCVLYDSEINTNKQTNNLILQFCTRTLSIWVGERPAITA